MTAKRFIIMDNLPKGTHSNIWDKQKQHNQGIGDELWLGEVVAMLNEGVILAEENEQLKQSVWSWSNSYNKVYQENQQLKNLIQHTYQIERTELGRNVLRQLLEAIQ